MGYRPNRNAQRLVLQRTHNIAWVQSANELKYLDPHFAEVMAGVLTPARATVNYDIVLTSHAVGREIATYDRYVHDNSVDGFIVDLPQEDDERITFLLEVGAPFVVHGREQRAGLLWLGRHGQLRQFLPPRPHADRQRPSPYRFRQRRRELQLCALSASCRARCCCRCGPAADALTIFNSAHPMGDAGFRLTQTALADTKVAAILYSSILLLVEGYEVLAGVGLRDGRPIAIATMDDEAPSLSTSRGSHLALPSFARRCTIPASR